MNYISYDEMDEISDEMVRSYMGNHITSYKCVDIEGFVIEYLGLKIVYESIAEDDKDKIGFISNGIYPLKVKRGNKIEKVVFPKKTIVIDNYLLQIDNSTQRRATIAHEAGHVITERLDPERNEGCFHRVFDTERKYDLNELHDRLNMYEWQAFSMGKALLMPKFLMKQTLEDFNTGRRLPVYGECVFHPREKVILKKMEDSLGVTHSSLINRLRGLDMLSHHDLSEYIVSNVIPGSDEQ